MCFVTNYFLGRAPKKLTPAQAAKAKKEANARFDAVTFQRTEDSPLWQKGSILYIGWPHYVTRQKRVCLRVLTGAKKYQSFGIFARDGKNWEDVGLDKPLVWVALTSSVDKVHHTFFTL